MSKLLKSWESYKRDFPNRKTKSIRVPNKKDKFWFIDTHNGEKIVVCLTEKEYTIELLPQSINMRSSSLTS